MKANHTRRIRFWSIALIVGLLSPPGEIHAGKLNRIRDQARTPSSDSGPSDDDDHRNRSRRDAYQHGHDSWHDHHDHDDDGFVNDLFGVGLLAALAGASSPFWAPYQLLGDDGEKGFQPDHPYDSAVGGLVYDKSAPGSHDTLFLLQGQYGDDFGGVSHANARMLLETNWRLGIDTEFYYRHEDGSPDDELWSGDFNVTWRFAQSEPLQFRAGVGFNWLADRRQEDYGFNFTYGADLFPGDPWILSSTIDWGRLGEATLFHARSTIGVTRNGWGLYTGYDYFNVGGAGLHAWINGIELRF